MSETIYTYRRTRRPDGTETYERVPYDPRAPVSEPPVLVPRISPSIKNGEFPGMGSVVLDSLLAKTEAAAAKRALRDAQDALAEAERIRAGLGQPQAPATQQKAYGRVVEP